MKIWRLTAGPEEIYDLFTTKEEWTLELARYFNGEKHLEEWNNIELVRLEPKKNLKLSDYPALRGNIPVFSDRVKKTVENMLGESVEFLPVKNSEGKFWIVNVISVLDCIDYSRAECERLSTGRVMCFKKYSFIKEKLIGKNIFKVCEEPFRHPLVSNEFKECIESNGFTGFEFKLVWDSKTEEDTVERNITLTKEINGSNFLYVGEIDSQTNKEIKETYISALERHGMTDIQNGAVIVKRVNEIVEEFLTNKKLPNEYCNKEEFCISMGVLFGQALHMAYGWEWKLLGNSKETAEICVVSPKGFYSNAPLSYFYRIISENNIGVDGKNDNTVELLFNMLEGIDDRPRGTMYFPIA